MKAYSTDWRQKIIEARQRGQATQRAIADLFGVSVSFVRKTPATLPHPRHLHRQTPWRRPEATTLDAAADPRIPAWIQAQPDLTVAQLQTQTHRELGISLSLAALRHHLKRLGPTRKLNIPTMALSLVYVDAASGALRASYTLDNRFLSIRHLAVGAR